MNSKKKVDGLAISTGLLIAGAVILFGFSWYMWQKFVYSSDNRVVWGAVEKALSTSGVEIVTDDSTDQNVQKVTFKLDFNGDIGAETRTEYKNETIDSVIKTVSTIDKDYLYYERNNNSQYPGLKVLEGQWVDIGIEGQTESKTLADTLTNGSLILSGNMPSSDRKKLIKDMRSEKLYTVIGLSSISDLNGKEVRTYKVKINSVAFSRALATYFKAMGLDQASSEVQQNGDAGLNPVVEMTIEPASRRFIATGYPLIGSVGSRDYSNWGSDYEFEVPNTYISSTELQKKTESIYTPTE